MTHESHCDYELPRYDPDLAMKMLLLSAAAYDKNDPQECLENALESDKVKIMYVDTLACDDDGNECFAYVAVSHVLKAIIIAFRGTDGFDQLKKEFKTARDNPMQRFLEKSAGEVQKYWKDAFKILWEGCMELNVKAFVSYNPTYQVWVTGHSLGGALASLASFWLAHHEIVPRKLLITCTFGAPRVGDKRYADEYDWLVNNSWRVVNFDDIVLHLPTHSDSPPSYPYHHGIEVFYYEIAVSPSSGHKECHGTPYNEDDTCKASIPVETNYQSWIARIENHKTYFSIHVGGFWNGETRCGKVGNTENLPNDTFQFKASSCSKYEYKNGSYELIFVSESSRITASKLIMILQFVFLLLLSGPY